MIHRFLAYPLLLLALLHALPLWRGNWRAHTAQLASLAAIILCAATALLWERFAPGFLVVGWLLLGLFVLLPRGLLAAAERSRHREQWRRAAHCTRIAGGCVASRLLRSYAQALHRLADSDPTGAEKVLDELTEQPLPAADRATVCLWKLQLLVQRRAWARAVACYENAPAWGTLWLATQARLHVARAYAELGQMNTGLRCLQAVLLSPVVVRLEEPVWAMRVRLAAMAGDALELERLLDAPRSTRRGFARFAAYWRGRCALAGGDRPEAIRHLSRAYAITDPRDHGWTSAIRYHLLVAEDADTVPTGTVSFEYDQELAALRHAESLASPWRKLMAVGWPAPVTLVLLAEIAIVFAVQVTLPFQWENRLIAWAGNGTFTIELGQWWRLWTTLFLHGGWLHLLMNGLALWMFGSAIERTAGWWRMLLIFLLGGAAGNLLSASVERHNIAIGASGGIFALLGAYGIALLRLPHPLYSSLRTRLLRMLLLLVAVDFSIGWLEPQVDNLAHVGGFVAGIVLAAVLGKITPAAESPRTGTRPT